VLAVVDVVLGIGVNEVIVERDLVLLEVRDSCMVDLESQRSDVHIVALDLLISLLNLSREICDCVNDGVL
jgi:hypothetical protein